MRTISRLVSVALPGLIGTSALAQPYGLSYPRPGTVCDAVGRVCYDSQGPSIGITADVYGRKAANQLANNLKGSNRSDFRLSTGQACSVAKRTCWDDGWAQRIVATALTRQLFGGNGRPGQAQVARDSGLCSLSREGRPVFDGRCMLRQMRQGGNNRYEIKLQNGNTYVFQQVGSNYQIRDGFGGSWPVSFVDHGNTGIFRFGNYTLVATQQKTNCSTPTNRDDAVGNAVNNLLKALFQ